MRKSGQIVLFRFPQTDLVVGKLRPALLIAPLPSNFDDWLVCMMSSRSRQAIEGIDELISPSEPDFRSTGLKAETIVRLTRLAVVTDSIFLGTIGELSDLRMQALRSDSPTGSRRSTESLSLGGRGAVEDRRRPW